MARQMTNDRAEQFTGAEFEPASDGKEAHGPVDTPENDQLDGAAHDPTAGTADAAAIAGDALMKAVERDLIGIEQGAEWTDETDEAGQRDAAAINDIMASTGTEQEKARAIEDMMTDRAGAVANAAQHLTAALTETDNTANDRDQDRRTVSDGDEAATMAAEVGRVTYGARDAAAMMVETMRTNAGMAAASTMTANLAGLR